MQILLRKFLKSFSHVGHVPRRLIMQDCCVHHVEFGVRNGEEFQRRFASQYKFFLAGTRFLSNIKQWVLKSQNATVLVTQPLKTEQLSNDPYFVPWQLNISDCIQTELDSVFNVALKVKNIEECINKLTRSGVEVVKEPNTVKDYHGSVRLAVIKSCVGNVVHTLIQSDDYSGEFLPGFDSLKPVNDVTKQLVSHFDHVAFVLERGDSRKVLDWYSQYLGMRRFLINRWVVQCHSGSYKVTPHSHQGKAGEMCGTVTFQSLFLQYGGSARLLLHQEGVDFSLSAQYGLLAVL